MNGRGSKRANAPQDQPVLQGVFPVRNAKKRRAPQKTPSIRSAVGRTLPLLYRKQYNDHRRAESQQKPPEQEIVIISRLRRFRVVRRYGKFLHTKLPIEEAHRVPKTVFKCHRNIQRHIKIDLSARADRSETDPLRELRRFIGSSVEQFGIAVLFYGKFQFGK